MQTQFVYTFFTKIAENLKYKAFKLRDFIWEKPPTLSTPMKVLISVMLVIFS